MVSQTWSLLELAAYESGRNESCDYICVVLAKLVWSRSLLLLFIYFLPFYGPRLSRGKKKLKKERGQYAAILTEQAWSIKYLLYGQKEDFSLRDQRRKFHHAGKMGVANQNTGFVASCSFGSSNDSFYKQSFLTIIIVVVSTFINHYVAIKVNRLMTNKTNEQTGKNVAKHHAVNLILLAYNSLKRITFHKRKTSPLFLEDFKDA